MIRETMIDAGCDEKYVNERLCGVNDMTFEEWEQYQDQMLRYYNVYRYDNGRTKKKMKTIHKKQTNHQTKAMNGMRTVEVAIATMTFV